MASLKMSSSHSSSVHSTESRNSEPVTGISSPVTPQLASKTHKTVPSIGRRKSSQSGSASRDETSSPALGRVKEARNLDASPIRKASSIQIIKKSDTPMKRTQSAQNISRSNLVAVQQPSTPNVNRLMLGKRASSSQNVSSKGRQRLSAPVSAMAYNAELLASFEKEKKLLERRISELIQTGELRKTENEKLKFELRNYKERVPPENVFEELELLRRENGLLRERLLEANISLEHFTDSEKLLILEKQNNRLQEVVYSKNGAAGGYDSNIRLHSASDADSNSKDFESVGDPSWMNAELRSCLSLDANWDKQSNKSSEGGMSEVSVACLQDRILQMEETHYSTNEELQATLQELTDLQDSVNELTSANELLADEKYVLLETLCSQTEKLENARLQIEQLKSLLLRDSESGQRSEFECQLAALVKSAQEEKEELLLKQIELSYVVQTLEDENHELHEAVAALKDKCQLDDGKLEGLTADKKTLEGQLGTLKEQSIKDQLDIQHLKALLENEKQKVAELEQERSVTSKSDLEALLDSTRQEKDRLEDRLTNEEQELSVKQNEIAKLKEVLEMTKTEMKALDESQQLQLIQLESQLKNAEYEKVEVQTELEAVREHNDQLQMNCDQFFEEKKNYTMTVARAESELRMARSKIARLETDLREKTDQFNEERESWRQFQQDLQTAVVIANDLKTETQEGMEKILADKEMLRDQNAVLRQEVEAALIEVERLKTEMQQKAVDASTPVVSSLDIRGKVLSTVDRELAVRRHDRLLSSGDAKAPSMSVKHRISSIEEQVKNNEALPVPLSPSVTNPIVLRRDSTDGSKSLSNAKSTDLSPRITTQRQLSSPSTESSLKSIIRRPNIDMKETRVGSHRHTISNIIMEGVTTVTDDDKQAVAESRAPSTHVGENMTDGTRKPVTEGTRKPLTGILTNKGVVRRKTTSGIGLVSLWHIVLETS